jgi:hypothetical protein
LMLLWSVHTFDTKAEALSFTKHLRLRVAIYPFPYKQLIGIPKHPLDSFRIFDKAHAAIETDDMSVGK